MIKNHTCPKCNKKVSTMEGWGWMPEVDSDKMSKRKGPLYGPFHENCLHKERGKKGLKPLNFSLLQAFRDLNL